MQFVRATSTATATLFLLLGTIPPAYARDEKREEKQGKSEKHQGKQQQGAQARGEQRSQGQAARPQAPQQRPQQQHRPQQVRQQQQPHRTERQAVAWQQQRGWLQQGGWQGHRTWQQGRARQWEREHRTWVQRGGYGGYYIPQDRFGLYFGSQRWFRMHNRPIIYMGHPRFEHSGFSFLLVDPWPEYWSENWYEADDVYVDYDQGYYLHNRRYPNIRLAITVVL